MSYEPPSLKLINQIERANNPGIGIYPILSYIAEGIVEILKWIRYMEGQKEGD